MAMEDCCEEVRTRFLCRLRCPHLKAYKAYEAQELLRNGTRDLPRMKKILENQRVRYLVCCPASRLNFVCARYFC